MLNVPRSLKNHYILSCWMIPQIVFEHSLTILAVFMYPSVIPIPLLLICVSPFSPLVFPLSLFFCLSAGTVQVEAQWRGTAAEHTS